VKRASRVVNPVRARDVPPIALAAIVAAAYSLYDAGRFPPADHRGWLLRFAVYGFLGGLWALGRSTNRGMRPWCEAVAGAALLYLVIVGAFGLRRSQFILIVAPALWCPAVACVIASARMTLTREFT
jgi:peptidoglycan/LPS O-acetylase OafA/YrhL